MRFLHLSDLHLGKRVCEFSMLDDQRYILEQVLSLLDAQPVDGVLLAGDLYDKPVPPAEAVRLLDWFLTELAARGLPVFAVSGNHDSADRIAFGAQASGREPGVRQPGLYRTTRAHHPDGRIRPGGRLAPALFESPPPCGTSSRTRRSRATTTPSAVC